MSPTHHGRWRGRAPRLLTLLVALVAVGVAGPAALRPDRAEAVVEPGPAVGRTPPPDCANFGASTNLLENTRAAFAAADVPEPPDIERLVDEYAGHLNQNAGSIRGAMGPSVGPEILDGTIAQQPGATAITVDPERPRPGAPLPCDQIGGIQAGRGWNPWAAGGVAAVAGLATAPTVLVLAYATGVLEAAPGVTACLASGSGAMVAGIVYASLTSGLKESAASILSNTLRSCFTGAILGKLGAFLRALPNGLIGALRDFGTKVGGFFGEGAEEAAGAIEDPAVRREMEMAPIGG